MDFEKTEQKTFLAVPFEAREEVKKLGARWDNGNRTWYAPIGSNLVPFKNWLPTSNNLERNFNDNLSAEQEFSKTLEALGLELDGLPIMDGTIQRVALKGRGAGNKDGAYCGYSDGIPAGWAHDYSTGEKIKFIATGHVLSDEEKTHQQAKRVQKLQERENERSLLHSYVSQEAFLEYEKGQAVISHPYLENKGIQPIGIKVNEKNQLLVPIRNVDEQVRGIQYINTDGSKFYKKGMEKNGNFCMINPHANDPIRHNEKPTQILICEGYATAVSLHKATGLHVAVAFDSGNLEAVATNIREKNPNSELIICADNDHAHTRMVEGKKVLYNVGVKKAKDADRTVNGTANTRVPIFSDKEKAQGLTDFNDLHKSQGLSILRHQLGLEKKIIKTKEKGLSR